MKMKLWIPVVYVIISFGTAKLPATAAAAPPVATCTLGQTTATDARPVLHGLRIECPQDTVLQQLGSEVQSLSSTVQVPTGAGGQRVPLSTLLPGGTYVRTEEAGVNVNTLRVSQLPGKPVQLYFECRHNDRAKTCYIQVNVLPAPREGPAVCAEVGSGLKLSVQAEQETVLFSCAAGFRLYPADPAKAFDGNCRHEFHLDDVLPGSYMQHAGDNGPNTLVVVYLPEPPQSLCYLCAPPGIQPNRSNSCVVRITTAAGSEGSPIPNTSVFRASGVTVSTTTVLGLVLIETGHLSIR